MLLAYYTLKTIKALITIRGFIKFVGCERRTFKARRYANFNRSYYCDYANIFPQIRDAQVLYGRAKFCEFNYAKNSRRPITSAWEIFSALSCAENWVIVRNGIKEMMGVAGKKDHLYRRNFIIEHGLRIYTRLIGRRYRETETGWKRKGGWKNENSRH